MLLCHKTFLPFKIVSNQESMSKLPSYLKMRVLCSTRCLFYWTMYAIYFLFLGFSYSNMHHLGPYLKCRLSGYTLKPLNQNLHFSRLPGRSVCTLIWRSTHFGIRFDPYSQDHSKWMLWTCHKEKMLNIKI